MSASAQKLKLSYSTDGTGIKVVATGTLGTNVHTATASTTTVWDEVWIYAYNGHTAAVDLTIEFGGATVPDQNIKVTIPYKQGLFLVVPGLLLQNAKVVTAFASVANVVVLSGFVNRITS